MDSALSADAEIGEEADGCLHRWNELQLTEDRTLNGSKYKPNVRSVASGRADMESTRGSIGLVGLLLLLGVVLFVFPEPATSGFGVTIILVAIVIWAASEIL